MFNNSDVFQAPDKDEVDRYLKSLNPGVGDRTYSVLKAHLMLEELLNEYVASYLRRPQALKGARLTFAQVLALAVAFHPFFEPDHWEWEALRRLNSLRNKMAHSVEVEDLALRSHQLAEYIVQNGGVPLPAAPGIVEGEQGNGSPNRAVHYALIDVALFGLYSGLRANFEVVVKISP